MWKPPSDNGGEDVLKYLVEYWNNTADGCGETAKHQIRFSAKITGGIFSLKLGNETFSRPISIDINANELEHALESFPNIGDVLVSSEEDDDNIDFFIEFLTKNSILLV